MTAAAAPYGTGRMTPNASRETGSRTKARRSSFPPPLARLSAQSSPTSFGKSGPSLMTACWRGRSTSGRVLAPLPSEQSDEQRTTIFPAAKPTPSERPSKLSTICRSSLMTMASAHPAVLRLASEARSPFNAAKRDCERRARRERGLIGEWLGKSPGRILRLALTFQLMTWSLSDGGAPPTSIGLDALERAIRYFHYAEGMLRRTLAGLEPSRSAEDALAVAKQIVQEAVGPLHQLRCRPRAGVSLVSRRGRREQAAPRQRPQCADRR